MCRQQIGGRDALHGRFFPGARFGPSAPAPSSANTSPATIAPFRGREACMNPSELDARRSINSCEAARYALGTRHAAPRLAASVVPRHFRVSSLGKGGVTRHCHRAPSSYIILSEAGIGPSFFPRPAGSRKTFPIRRVEADLTAL